MAQLTIHQLDDAVAVRLRERAAAAGRSMEQEAPENDSEAALRLVGRVYLLAPDPLAIEATNALCTCVRRHELTAEEARTALADLLTVPVENVTDRALAPAALSLPADLGHPATIASIWPWP